MIYEPILQFKNNVRRCPVTKFSSMAEKSTLDSFLIVVAATKALAIFTNDAWVTAWPFFMVPKYLVWY